MRRAGISSISFRLPAVWNNDLIQRNKLRHKHAERRNQLDEFRKLPSAEQQSRLAAAKAIALKLRARHIMEFDAIQSGAFQKEAPLDDWLFSAWFVDRFNFWTFIHTYDSTQAFEKAITAEFQGAHPLFVNSDINYLNYETEALLSLFFPEVTRRKKPVIGAESPVSISHARDLIGFEPTVRRI